MYQGRPNSLPTAFSHPRMKHIRISCIYGPQRLLISILGAVPWFERAPLPGEHNCRHIGHRGYSSLWKLVKIMKPPKTCPSSPYELDLLQNSQNCSVWGRFAKIRQGEAPSPAITPSKIPGKPRTVTGSRWTCSSCMHKVKEMVKGKGSSTYEPSFLVAFLCSYFQIIHYPKSSFPPSLEDNSKITWLHTLPISGNSTKVKKKK